jgi:hypothetical protein
MPKSGKNDETIVYGEVDWHLVALPLARVEELTALVRGFRASKTWGQLRANLPQEDFELLLENSGEEDPPDGDSVDPEKLVGSLEGNYPPWPAQEMLNRLPGSIVDRFVSAFESPTTGPAGQIDPEKEAEFVSALRALGYTVVRDDERIKEISWYGDRD